MPDGSGLTVIPQWISGEELTGFIRNLCAVGFVITTGTVYEWAVFGPALGNDPYYRDGSVFTEVGTFAVGDIANIEDPGSFRLKDSQDNLLAGGTLEYFDAEWKTATEVSDGIFEFATEEETVSLRMHYEGGLQQVDNIIVVYGYTFHTEQVTVELLNSSGNGLEDGQVKYMTDDWWNFGKTNSDGLVTKELLPVIYSFEMEYDNVKQLISNYDVSTDPVVTFNTVVVTAEFVNSEGAGISGSDIEYYTNRWKVFGVTDQDGIASKELLPVTYSFKVSFENAEQEITDHDVFSDPVVNFNTIEVTVELLDDLGDGISGGVSKFKTQGWKDFGITDEDGQSTRELLPVTYSFRMEYDRNKQKISDHNTGDDPVVTFYESDLKLATLNDLGNAELSLYPNPFRDQAFIKFKVSTTGSTTLKIYNTKGFEIANLFEGFAEAGYDYEIEFNDFGLPDGIYMIHLLSGDKVNILKKIILAK